MGAAAAFGARFEDNRLVPAFVWNFGIGALSLGIVFFAMRLLQTVAP